MPAVFTGHRRTGALIGAVITVLALGAALFLSGRVAAAPLTLASFTGGLAAAGLLASALAFGYWTWGAATLRYRLTRNTLIIEWAGNQERVPLTAIQNLIPGADLPPPRRTTGVGWRGYRIGRAVVQDQPVLVFAAYRSPADLLYVQTARAVYAIAPGDTTRFAEEVKRRIALGPSTTEAQRNRRWLPWQLSAWHDRFALGLLGAGLVVNLALFAYGAFTMPAVPEETVLRLSPVGAAEATGPRGELLLLPLTGLGVLVVNAALGILLHLWERFAAYLALATGVIVQGLLFLATVRLLS